MRLRRRAPSVVAPLLGLLAACSTVAPPVSVSPSPTGTTAPSTPASGHDSPSALPGASSTAPGDATESPEGVGRVLFFPVYDSTDALPDGSLSASLVEQDGCLWLEDDDVRWLALWPPGSQLVGGGDRVEILDANGATLAVVGERVLVGGGESDARDSLVAEVLDAPVPDACRSDSYWVVTEVLS